MKNLIIAANWKSHMSKTEAKNWLEEFSILDLPEGVEVVLFAPYTLLDMVSSYIKVNDISINLGAQNISPFDNGAYTGEVTAEQVKEFCSYVLIGHSERRSNFSETDEMVNKKIEKAEAAGLKIIVCVSSLSQAQSLKTENLVIAYEPVESIGTGNAEDPNDVGSIGNKLKEIKNSIIIYGGSVNPENIKNYTDLENINGALVGSESLHPQSFSNIIKNAV